MESDHQAATAISLARTALTDPAGLPDGEGPAGYMPPNGGVLRDYAVAKLDEALGLLEPEDPRISFSGEAGETFQTFVSWLGSRSYTVEARTIDGEEFTATVCGVDPNSDWSDAVLLRVWNEGLGAPIGPIVSHRIAELHVL